MQPSTLGISERQIFDYRAVSHVPVVARTPHFARRALTWLGLAYLTACASPTEPRRANDGACRPAGTPEVVMPSLPVCAEVGAGMGAE